VTSIPVTARPHDATADTSGGVWTSFSDSTIRHFTGTTNDATINTAALVLRLTHDPVNNRIWAVSQAARTVQVYDATTGAALVATPDALPDVSPVPTVVDTIVDPTRNRAYVVYRISLSTFVRTYDLTTMAKLSEDVVYTGLATTAVLDRSTGILLISSTGSGNTVIVNTLVTPLVATPTAIEIKAVHLAINPSNGDLIATTGTQPNTPTPQQIYRRTLTSTDGQTIGVTVPEFAAGELVWEIDADDHDVSLTEAANAGAYWQSTGEIKPIKVTDSRPGGGAWSISGQVSDFTGGVSGKYLGWTPKVTATGSGATPGVQVQSGFTAGNGVKDASTLASASVGHAGGTATLGADLDLKLPIATPAGTYSATLTITALS